MEENKKKIKIKASWIFVISVVALVVIFVFVVNFKEYKREKQEEMRRFNRMADKYLSLINGPTDEDIHWNKIDVSQLVHVRDTTTVKINMAYYNFYSDVDVDEELLTEEYKNFCDGKSKKSYSNLTKYIDFLSERETVNRIDVSPNNLRYDEILEVIREQLLHYYDIESYSSDEFKNLTLEEIEEVCNIILPQKEKIYLYILRDRISNRSDMPHRLLYTGFDQEEMETNSQGETVVYAEDGAICYYLEYGNISLLTDEEEWYVYKMELLDSTDEYFDIGGCDINEIREDSEYDIELWKLYSVVKTKNESIYYRDNIVITMNFYDDVSVKVTVELNIE